MKTAFAALAVATVAAASLGVARWVTYSAPHHPAFVAVGHGRAAMDGARNAMDGARNAMDGARNAMDGARNAMDGARNTVAGAHSAIDGAHSVIDGARSAIDGVEARYAVQELNASRFAYATPLDWAASGDFDECEHRDVRNLNASASTSDLLAIGSGSGDVRVDGRDGATAVSVEAELCASDEELLRELSVRLDREGNQLVLEALYPDDRDGWWRDRYARVNLVVTVPAGMPVGIDDGSGGIDVSAVGNLVIHDGSGYIDAFDVRGDVRIDDGSGDVTLRNVAGAVEISEGAVSFQLEDIRGRLDIDDGSGEIFAEGVQGDVEIDDGSGEIRVYDAGGSVTVDDSSGSIIVRGVQGDFRVRNDSSGSIEHSNVVGVVDLPRRR